MAVPVAAAATAEAEDRPALYPRVVSARDTSDEARAAQRQALRRLGGAARVEMAFAMSLEAREIATDGLLRRHPELSREQARHRVLRRLLGEALWSAAYGRRRS